MKYCPICETRYDEEVIRFCTKDGTPLVDEEQPNFIGKPSGEPDSAADDDDPGEVTIIRRKSEVPVPVPVPPPDLDEDTSFQASEIPPQRIVVPTTPTPRDPYPGRPAGGAYYAPPQKSNTAKVVVLTMLGTIILLGGAIALFLLLREDTPANENVDMNANLDNTDINLNTNLGLDTNFNFNTNSGVNANMNANANANKSPTPTPKPSPSPSPSPTATPDEDEPPANANTRPPVNATPAATPQPRPTAPPSNRPVNAGVLNGRAISLATPAYPAAARQMRASGQVTVQVSVDENGRVVSARAVSGHPLLRSPAENAAMRSRISPVRSGGGNVPATGVLLYNFVGN